MNVGTEEKNGVQVEIIAIPPYLLLLRSQKDTIRSLSSINYSRNVSVSICMVNRRA